MRYSCTGLLRIASHCACVHEVNAHESSIGSTAAPAMSRCDALQSTFGEVQAASSNSARASSDHSASRHSLSSTMYYTPAARRSFQMSGMQGSHDASGPWFKQGPSAHNTLKQACTRYGMQCASCLRRCRRRGTQGLHITTVTQATLCTTTQQSGALRGTARWSLARS